MPLTIDRIKVHMLPYEGYVAHMYLCKAGRVTVGIGNMLSSVTAAQALAFVDRTTKNKATAEAIKADYENVAKQTAGLPHAKYRPHTKLDMLDVDINQLFKRRVGGFETDLRDLYAEYDLFPEDVQLALLDMVFNLGKGGLKKFVNFGKAIEAKDWAKAAENSNRVTSTADRNGATKLLLEAAAKAGTEKKD
jgi:GH24 family phage-related lysozyme (muramidase)